MGIPDQADYVIPMSPKAVKIGLMPGLAERAWA